MNRAITTPASDPSRLVNSSVLRLLLPLAIAAGGCGRPAPPEARDENALLPPEESAKIEAQLIPPPNTNPNAPAAERLHGAVHPGLTMRLQMYIEKTGRIPDNIYEFSNTAVDSMPPAPAGMKYAIDPVDQAVKVVRK